MEKFIVFNASSPKFIVSADVIFAEIVSNDLKLSYHDKQVVVQQTGAATAADVAKVNNAIASVWSQGYTEASIPVTLSTAVTGVS